MKASFPVRETIEKRGSVRTYDERPLTDEDKAKLTEYAKSLSNPFGVPVTVRLLETENASSKKMGTYGVIKGTKIFLGVTVPKGELSLEAAGYSFEQLILYATSLGIGTCWLAATFDRKAFTKELDVKPDEWFPVISPVGYAAKKRAVSENLMRVGMGSDKRKPWKELFFRDDFETPLSRQEAGDLVEPLDLLRLAPSATNAQPWRVLLRDGDVHFYAKTSEGMGEVDPPIIQRVDVGICACHFHLAAQALGLSGDFIKAGEPEQANAPKDFRYLFSWISGEDAQ